MVGCSPEASAAVLLHCLESLGNSYFLYTLHSCPLPLGTQGRTSPSPVSPTPAYSFLLHLLGIRSVFSLRLSIPELTTHLPRCLLWSSTWLCLWLCSESHITVSLQKYWAQRYPSLTTNSSATCQVLFLTSSILYSTVGPWPTISILLPRAYEPPLRLLESSLNIMSILSLSSKCSWFPKTYLQPTIGLEHQSLMSSCPVDRHLHWEIS